MLTEKELYETEKKEIERLLTYADETNFKIRLLNHTNSELTAVNDKEIEKLKGDLTSYEFQMEQIQRKVKDKIETKAGWTHLRIMPIKHIFDALKVIPYIKEKYCKSWNKYIKVEETLKKNDLKKAIEIGIINITQGYTTEVQPSKFEYKITLGGKK